MSLHVLRATNASSSERQGGQALDHASQNTSAKEPHRPDRTEMVLRRCLASLSGSVGLDERRYRSSSAARGKRSDHFTVSLVCEVPFQVRLTAHVRADNSRSPLQLSRAPRSENSTYQDRPCQSLWVQSGVVARSMSIIRATLLQHAPLLTLVFKSHAAYTC